MSDESDMSPTARLTIWGARLSKLIYTIRSTGTSAGRAQNNRNCDSLTLKRNGYVEYL